MKLLRPLCTLPLLMALPSQAMSDPAARRLEPIEHIIVITLENHSFDNLFGHFPGAEGIDNAGHAAIQVDRDGKPYKTLPPIRNTGAYPSAVDTRFPTDLPNQPFPIEAYVPAGENTGDLTHRYYEEKEQIHDGTMNRFAAVSEAGGLTMGYYDGSKLGLWEYAKKYTLADHFFHAAFGGSFLNHMWLVCACTPRFPNPPDELAIRFNANGEMIKNGSVTEDGYAVNTIFPSAEPRPPFIKHLTKLLPPQDLPTIGDRLSEKHISWAWYASGWDDAVAGKANKSFQFHHQPFVYFKPYAEGTAERTEHLKDGKDFIAALKDGTLPAVAFYKPLGEFNLHPGYGNVTAGDAHITDILKAIEASPVWKSSVVIVTFDEGGGYWDHVPPPRGDRWGPGVRVPAIIISPFARKGYVDHTQYDTTSILKFIEARFDLKPLSDRDAKAVSIGNLLELHK